MESEKILKSPYCLSKEIVDLFHKLLKESGYNLNQLAGNNAFLIPEGVGEDFVDDLKKFLGLINAAYKENKDTLKALDSLEKGEHSDKFIVLLERYLELSGQPAKETAFIKELTIEEFRSMAGYCYSNCIMNNSDITQNTESWKAEQLHTIRKVILSISELVVLLNYSKQRVLERINMMFCLDDDYGEILWNIAKENENQLWKYLMVVRTDRIEEKLDLLLELVQNSR